MKKIKKLAVTTPNVKHTKLVSHIGKRRKSGKMFYGILIENTYIITLKIIK